MPPNHDYAAIIRHSETHPGPLHQFQCPYCPLQFQNVFPVVAVTHVIDAHYRQKRLPNVREATDSLPTGLEESTMRVSMSDEDDHTEYSSMTDLGYSENEAFDSHEMHAVESPNRSTPASVDRHSTEPFENNASAPEEEASSAEDTNAVCRVLADRCIVLIGLT